MTADGIPPVRPADPDEFHRLRWIELESDRLYESVGIGPFANDDSENHLADAVIVFASGDPAIGFISLEVVDDVVHIDQISVLPDRTRHGIGRAMLDEALRWARAAGYPAVTLTTFRDVPWNAPFYARLGFTTVERPGPGLAAIREHERETGFDAYGPRLAMRLEL